MVPRNETGEASLWRSLADLEARGESAALATVVATHGSTPRHAGARMIVRSDASLVGTVGGGRAEVEAVRAAQRAIETGECELLDLDLTTEHGVCGGAMQIFVEPVLQGIPFLVVGAGHVGKAVATMAHTLPLRLTVIDDRPDVLSGIESLSGVVRWPSDPEDFAARLRIPARGGILIASRNHELDARYLQSVFAAEREQGREFLFCGLLASCTKTAKLRNMLCPSQVEQERWMRLQAPVGLDLGSETPAEIALSILSEAMSVLRGVDPLCDEEGRPLAIRIHRRRGDSL